MYFNHNDKDRPAELLMGENQALQSDRELDITTSNHVLNFEVQKFCRETEFLYYSCIFPGGQTRLLLTGEGHNTHIDYCSFSESWPQPRLMVTAYLLTKKVLGC